MSARANPYDNAWTESFIGTLKNEMLQDGCFESADDARTELFDYIKGYYNTHRKHSSLGDKTPNEFEQKFSLLNEDNTGPKISCTSHPHVCGDVAIRHSPLGSSPRVWSNGANTISRRVRSASTMGVAC